MNIDTRDRAQQSFGWVSHPNSLEATSFKNLEPLLLLLLNFQSEVPILKRPLHTHTPPKQEHCAHQPRKTNQSPAGRIPPTPSEVRGPSLPHEATRTQAGSGGLRGRLGLLPPTHGCRAIPDGSESAAGSLGRDRSCGEAGSKLEEQPPPPPEQEQESPGYRGWEARGAPATRGGHPPPGARRRAGHGRGGRPAGGGRSAPTGRKRGRRGGGCWLGRDRSGQRRGSGGGSKAGVGGVSRGSPAGARRADSPWGRGASPEWEGHGGPPTPPRRDLRAGGGGRSPKPGLLLPETAGRKLWGGCVGAAAGAAGRPGRPEQPRLQFPGRLGQVPGRCWVSAPSRGEARRLRGPSLCLLLPSQASPSFLYPVFLPYSLLFFILSFTSFTCSSLAAFPELEKMLPCLFPPRPQPQ